MEERDIDFNVYNGMSLNLILNDANTIKIVYENIQNEDFASVFFMGIIPYISIWIDSTSEFFKQMNIEIYTTEDKELVKEIRSKIKMYNEKIKKNVEKSNLIYEFHNSLFKSTSKYKFIRILNLYDDFGTYLSNNKYIGNTYLYNWYYGCSRKKEIGNMDIIREKSYKIGEILGSTLQILGEFFDKDSKKILLDNKLEISYKDYNLSNRSSKIFNNTYDKDITLILFNILCSINFVLYFLNNILPKDNFLYFRIKYNCYYYSMYSLNKIIDYNKINKYDSYTLESKINKLKIEDRIVRNRFRNCMSHYQVTNYDLEEDEILLDVPFYGLIEKYFGKDFNSLNREIYEKLTELSNILEDLILMKK